MTEPQPHSDVDPKGWEAYLNLGFTSRRGKTLLQECNHHGPLRVQRPFYPEGDVCHCYILHPPGGVVGSDSLQLKIESAPNSHALLTTPGATKFYRSGGRLAKQHQHLKVHGGIVEWFPQENIIFPGADATISTRIDLDTTAGFFGWEILCLGLPTQKEEFDQGTVTTELKLYRENIPLLIDRLSIRGSEDLHSVATLRGYPVTATCVATWVTREMVEELLHQLPQTESCLVGITTMGELMVARYLGYSTFEAREIFEQLWTWLRPKLFNRESCPPRIWAT